MAALFQPLFYAADIARSELVSLVFSATGQAPVDVVTFADETGGDQDRALALPYLPGMDAVVVDAASLRFRVGAMTLETTQYTVSPGPAGQGAVLKLAMPMRLLKLELGYKLPTGGRLIVRPVQSGGFGPPILSAPPLAAPGPTYGPALAGLSAADAAGDRHVARFEPGLLGSAWLLQVATGDDTKSLAPVAAAITVTAVFVAAAPRNLSVVLQGPPDTPLWSNKEALLPEAGEQVVSFQPMAQRQLSAALKSPAASALTLPLSLRFHSDAAARVEVTERTLSGHYTIDPLAGMGGALRLGGRAAALALLAPGALRPRDGAATLTAKVLGRTLNGGSTAAPSVLPGHGLRLAAGKVTAARVAVAPSGDQALVALAAAALRITATEASEVTVELLGDAAGRPGAALAPAVVQQVAAGFDGWLDAVLRAPLPVAAGSLVWISLRLTKGTVLWHAGATSGAAAGMVSADKGASWAVPTRALEESAPLLAQLFHVLDPPLPRPLIAMRSGAAILLADWFTAAVPGGAREYRLSAAPLPPAALDLLRRAPASGSRTATTLSLYSDQVLDLTVSDAVIAYDPATARVP